MLTMRAIFHVVKGELPFELVLIYITVKNRSDNLGDGQKLIIVFKFFLFCKFFPIYRLSRYCIYIFFPEFMG